MKHLLLTALLSIALTVQAASSADKLKAIQDRLNINFCSILTDVQKIQATNQVYQFLTTTENQNTYGFGKLVDTLYIDCPSSYDAAARTQLNSRLRTHSLVVDFNLASLKLFESRIALEEQILSEIESQQPSLFTFQRNTDLLTETTSSNESFLQLVNAVKQIVPDYLRAGSFADVEQVVINDNNNSYNNASAALVPSYYHRNKRTLIVSVGRLDESQGDRFVVDNSGLETLVKTVTQNQFVSIDTGSLDNTEVNTTLSQFSDYLSSDIVDLLQSNGVKQIRFTEHPEKAQNLFQDGTLTLGTTTQGMEFVVNLLFR
ncbi:MAG: hypothetical protein ACXVAX_03125 [Pseudobdellovibrio sp.]